ncbi:uncharacterized protein LOC117183106 isoform X2 [Belonocnema kinseyi]|uniref:uncharacterized protein LOC117183106 isoform X2 n=1 Tax=Belonocnema kinseyi TaxID=2817044 RepID=UPI00143CDE6C|nr:uncharacterized protein LOC117183106 isoform X2 [Belonocnema kinseyi]
MSHETPRSSAGLSTPRTYAEIFSDLDIFKEADCYQKPLSKLIHNNLKDWTHENPERDLSCGNLKNFGKEPFFENKNLLLPNKDSCVECEWKFSHKIATLEEKLADESQIRNQQIIKFLYYGINSIDRKIITEHEKNIQERLAEKNKEIEYLKQERRKVEVECAESKEHLEITTKHLDNLESSFNDVHEKYEKAKQAIFVLQRNVEILKESISEHGECIRQKHNQFSQLKDHAIERLNYANLQLDLMERKFFLESSKLRASVNESELHARSLSEQLERKNRENTELVSICEGLISRMDLPANLLLKNIMVDYGEELVSLKDDK